MAVIDRMARLLRADIHAVMDRIEDPQQLLRCAIRDMEDELERGAQRRAEDIERAEGLKAAIEERDRWLAQQDGELDLAFADGRDDLARFIVHRKLAAELEQRQLKAELEKIADRVARSEALAEEREGLVAELRLEAERCAATDSVIGARPPSMAGVSDADIDIALLREQHARRTS